MSNSERLQALVGAAVVGIVCVWVVIGAAVLAAWREPIPWTPIQPPTTSSEVEPRQSSSPQDSSSPPPSKWNPIWSSNFTLARSPSKHHRNWGADAPFFVAAFSPHRHASGSEP